MNKKTAYLLWRNKIDFKIWRPTRMHWGNYDVCIPNSYFFCCLNFKLLFDFWITLFLYNGHNYVSKLANKQLVFNNFHLRVTISAYSLLRAANFILASVSFSSEALPLARTSFTEFFLAFKLCFWNICLDITQ